MLCHIRDGSLALWKMRVPYCVPVNVYLCRLKTRSMQQPDKATFYQDVYSVVKEIPRGKVISYGEIARLIGWSQYSRMVGKAMSQVPAALKLPCHRVVNSNGRTVPGWIEQRILLEKEDVWFKGNGCVAMRRCAWHWEEF